MLIAILLERIAEIFALILNLHISPLPFEMIGFSVDMLWHIKNNRDLLLAAALRYRGHVWLRTILMQRLYILMLGENSGWSSASLHPHYQPIELLLIHSRCRRILSTLVQNGTRCLIVTVNDKR